VRKTTKRTKPDPEAPPAAKTVGLFMQAGDLVALAVYRADQGRATMVTPKEGPAALAIYRAGLRALGYTVPS
jgi:hypothetical protein